MANKTGSILSYLIRDAFSMIRVPTLEGGESKSQPLPKCGRLEVPASGGRVTLLRFL